MVVVASHGTDMDDGRTEILWDGGRGELWDGQRLSGMVVVASYVTDKVCYRIAARS